MFITKSDYKKFKQYWLPQLQRSTPLTLRVSASRYREKALSTPEKTADFTRTSIRMLKQSIVCERLLTQTH
jgi:hypothetical protein